MANNFQSTLTGSAELKDYYDDNSRREAIYEALRRIRKKRMDLRLVPQDTDNLDRQKELKP